MTRSPELPTRPAALAFLVAAITLFLQVLVHRIVAVKLLNNYAFFVISLTMLGFALSGVILSVWLARVEARVRDFLCGAGVLGAVSVLVITHVFLGADTGERISVSREAFVQSLFRALPLAALYAVPFAFLGFMLGVLLSLRRLQTRRVYAFDLAGSALGALLIVPAIGRFGANACLLLAAALLLVGVAVLAPPRHWSVRAAWCVGAVALCAFALWRESLFAVAYPPRSVLGTLQKGEPPYGIEYVAWDPLARIEVSRIAPPDPDNMLYPCLLGGNRAFHQRFLRMLTQNNWADTFAVSYDGQRESLRGIEETIYAAAYEASSVSRPRALVIGVGGGLDVLTALAYESSRVVGVEVNAATVDILTRRYREYFAPWVSDPRVRLVLADGRQYLAANAELFDVIQLSGVDSYSGTPAAAHVFSENYLYTQEAFDLYLSHLAPDGILNVMRLDGPAPRDMLRATVTAVHALRRAGVHEPGRHIAVVSASNHLFVALLVKRTPFTDDETARLARWTGSSRFIEATWLPGRLSRPDLYNTYLTLAEPRKEEAFVAAYPLDVSPVTDDRPFFFRFSFWSDLFAPDPLVRRNVPAMEYSLAFLLTLLSLAAVVCVYVPLRVLARRGALAPGTAPQAGYFALLGLGYMGVELALLQRFGLFLGHPNYALSIVLATLLAATGVGSLSSQYLVRHLGGLRNIALWTAALIVVQDFAARPLLAHLAWLPLGARALVVVALVGPLGALLGVFFPHALDRLKGGAGARAPWAWGVNGIFSVLGPVLAVALSMTWGIRLLLVAAALVYLAVGRLGPDAWPEEPRVPSAGEP